MKSFLALAVPALMAIGAIASPCKPPPFCLTDDQAATVYNGFMDILTNPDRQAANATAQVLIAENYNETSDSINILAGFPLGSVTFAGKTEFIDGVVLAPAISGMSTLMSFHDCTHVAWHWIVTGLGKETYEVKGTNLFTVAPSLQVTDDQIEFNSIAWGGDTGYTTTNPNGTVI